MLRAAHPVLLWGAVGNVVIAVLALGALLLEAEPILGVHPALKPMKFGLSVAIFLGSMALVTPSLSVDQRVRDAIAWTLLVTMVIEVVPIVLQALRGTTSHFNTRAGLDGVLWQLMAVAIVIATVTMVAAALIATVRPLLAADGQALDWSLRVAWCAGLWFFLFAAWSGFAMAGRGAHSVGGADGGGGIAVVNWSRRHGDLRVSHFIAVHALQSLPLTAVLLRWLPLGELGRGVAMVLVIAAHGAVVVATMLQALGGRPLW